MRLALNSLLSSILLAVPLISTAAASGGLPPDPFLEEHFDDGAGTFVYGDDLFRGTSEPGYANGTWTTLGAYSGGGLRATLGGIDNSTVQGMSAGWTFDLVLAADTNVVVAFRYDLIQAGTYESDEPSEVLLSVDGSLVGSAPDDYVAQITGDGNSGDPIATGWQRFEVDLGVLTAGPHTFAIGTYNAKKTLSDEFTDLFLDDVIVSSAPVDVSPVDAAAAVAELSFTRFKSNIETLSGFGDRSQFGAGDPSYGVAETWAVAELAAMGYTVEYHDYTFEGFARQSFYVTKVGTERPDRMYIVSAHFDGRGGGGAADDDASGSSLVMEIARVLSLPQFECDTSVRLIWWNNEETGLNGSAAYASDRAGLQGVENPPGSGMYPEPTWLGLIQHDMILFDHGLPAQPNQIPGADVDIEFQISASLATEGLSLAGVLFESNGVHSLDYPSEIGSNMRNTDSWPFRNLTASVSVRENQRIAEIGAGANPHWHQPTDVYATFSEEDFLLGFNATQMTMGAVARLAGLREVSVTAAPGAPVRGVLRMLPNVPDPFNPATDIRFVLERREEVGVSIYDARGRHVALLHRGTLAAGQHSVRWNGRGDDGAVVASGTYYARVEAAGEVQTEKLGLLK